MLCCVQVVRELKLEAVCSLWVSGDYLVIWVGCGLHADSMRLLLGGSVAGTQEILVIDLAVTWRE